MKIVSKFAFVVLVAVFVLVGAPHAKASGTCSGPVYGACMSSCGTAMNTCIYQICMGGSNYGIVSASCANYCQQQENTCWTACCP